MRKVIIKWVVILSILFSYKTEVFAEQVIKIVIPDEIKICYCNCGCKNKCEKREVETVEIQSQNPRNTSVDVETEKVALQRIAIAEAGNTDAYTMAYIMQTVLNRVASDEFPNTVQEVIKQKGQFSTYPSKYNNSKPNELSKQAYELLPELENQHQLYFENTIEGSWQSTNLQWVFNYNVLSFYK